MIRAPLATYRVQLRPDFGFYEAAAIAPYLAELGVSHLYASPYLQAAPGSTHGYDVVSWDHANEELGGEEGRAALCAALAHAGLSHILDIVPNHMAISGPENAWWWDVLENGPASRYAGTFDVEWEPAHAREANKVLLPILGDHYGRVLEAGELRIERSGGRLAIRYYDHVVPAAPRSLRALLAPAAEAARSDELAFLADAAGELPWPSTEDRRGREKRHRDKEVIFRLLAAHLEGSPAAAEAVDEEIERVHADIERFDAFLSDQNYRLAYWRTAGDELGYRRFFDINSLVGLRMEDEAVFADTHRRVLQWLRSGQLDGLRIDHPDGLRDPEGYLHRLREAAPEAYIVVEKILHPGEHLPASWPVQGTTGYDFMSLVGGLFLDPAGAAPLAEVYAEATGIPAPVDGAAAWQATVREKKHFVLRELFGSDHERLVSLAARVCERHRRHRDYTRRELGAALATLIACVPVYRTYVRAGTGESAGDEDRAILLAAGEAAAADAPELDPALFAFLRDVLSLRWPGPDEAALVLAFQQLTGAVEAKGVEDTAFYTYHRLIALNEVGSDPSRFGTSLDAFHLAMLERQAHSPLALSATSTHDTKRSEDVRARLALLSERPAWWGKAARRLTALVEEHRPAGFADPNLEYLLLQLLVGGHPVSGPRLEATLLKSAREAKERTSWTHADAAYEAGLAELVRALYDDPRFLAEVERVAAPLVGPGRVNALAQTLIKMTAPGVPDVYQGTERWDLSFVDPDNRRPVDFALHHRLLEEARGLAPDGLWARADEGLPKLWLTHRALGVRRALPAAFGPLGAYRRLEVSGRTADHVVAFTRAGQVSTVVPRLLLRLANGSDTSAIAQLLGDVEVELPTGPQVDAFTGARVEGGRTPVAELLSLFPVALLVPEGALP